MEHLKLFESFNKVDIHEICKEYGIKNYTINKDGSIDVNGNVNLYHKKLYELLLKFNKVNGYFSCLDNMLSTLDGCPKIVGTYYICSFNSLTSLEGCPKTINGDFTCESNLLTSLKGCPESIGGNFYCNDNKLTTFEYFPKHLGDVFHCSDNPIWHIWKLFRDATKIELFNDMDIIQDDVIIFDRLNFFLEEIGRSTVSKIAIDTFTSAGYKCV